MPAEQHTVQGTAGPAEALRNTVGTASADHGCAPAQQPVVGMRQQFVGNKFRPSRIPGKPDARAIVSVAFGEVGGEGTKNTTVPAGAHPPGGCGVIENGCFKGSWC